MKPRKELLETSEIQGMFFTELSYGFGTDIGYYSGQEEGKNAAFKGFISGLKQIIELNSSDDKVKAQTFECLTKLHNSFILPKVKTGQIAAYIEIFFEGDDIKPTNVSDNSLGGFVQSFTSTTKELLSYLVYFEGSEEEKVAAMAKSLTNNLVNPFAQEQLSLIREQRATKNKQKQPTELSSSDEEKEENNPYISSNDVIQTGGKFTLRNLMDQLSDGEDKDELLDLINKAQEELDLQHKNLDKEEDNDLSPAPAITPQFKSTSKQEMPKTSTYDPSRTHQELMQDFLGSFSNMKFK